MQCALGPCQGFIDILGRVQFEAAEAALFDLYITASVVIVAVELLHNGVQR